MVLFLSDIHFGDQRCRADRLLEVLNKYSPEAVYLIGDIIDFEFLRERIFWTQDYTNVLVKLLSYTSSGTKLFYVTGNHDDYLRKYSPFTLENIQVVDETVYKNYLVIHGDKYGYFDSVEEYESTIARKAVGYDGVICGHSHTPSNKEIVVDSKKIHYLNTGDWVENYSYLIYTDKFELISYGKQEIPQLEMGR